MNHEALTAPEAAKLLHIAPNTVYALVKRGELPCYKVGRKMFFRYSEIQNYISGTGSKNTAQVSPEKTDLTGGQDNHLIKNTFSNVIDPAAIRICGKDEILDMLAAALRRNLPSAKIERVDKDSYNSLIDLYHDRVTAAACHMWDSSSDSYNAPFVRIFLPGVPCVRIHVAKRIQGFYVQQKNPKNITGWEDLNRSGIVLANREPGAGTRILLDQHLQEMRLSGQKIAGYDDICSSHLEVAVKVSKGEADLGIGTEKTARNISGLDFIPLQQEDYELVIKEENMEKPEVKEILAILQSPEFQEQFRYMNGYDVSQMGEIAE